ncbi:hypothetical protein EDB85DRAFT_2017784 [Lactarius pseudohatsudake]|nr:hypothetical protein EDB85DRAFT_2017784 [Lactarius pseudohatsudake]
MNKTRKVLYSVVEATHGHVVSAQCLHWHPVGGGDVAVGVVGEHAVAAVLRSCGEGCHRVSCGSRRHHPSAKRPKFNRTGWGVRSVESVDDISGLHAPVEVVHGQDHTLARDRVTVFRAHWHVVLHTQVLCVVVVVAVVCGVHQCTAVNHHTKQASSVTKSLEDS